MKYWHIYLGKSLDIEKISNKKAFTVSAKGLTQSPEGRLVFNGLTVEDNLKAGGYSLKTKKEIVDGKEVKITASQQLQDNFERVYRLFPNFVLCEW